MALNGNVNSLILVSQYNRENYNGNVGEYTEDWSIKGSQTGSSPRFEEQVSGSIVSVYFISDLPGNYDLHAYWDFEDYNNSNGDDHGEKEEVVTLAAVVGGITQTHQLVDPPSGDCGKVGIRITGSDPFNKVNGVDITSASTYTIEKEYGEDLLVTIEATDQSKGTNSLLNSEVVPDMGEVYVNSSYMDVVCTLGPAGNEFTYSYDGSNYITDHVHHYSTPGVKTVLVKDKYGCVKTFSIEAIALPVIDISQYPEKFYISKSNSLGFVERVSSNYYKTDENTFGCEVDYKNVKYSDIQMFKSIGKIQTQIATNYGSLSAILFNAETSQQIRTLPITKKISNLNSTEVRNITETHDLIYSYISFDGGKIPFYYEVGAEIVFGSETRQILDVFFDGEKEVIKVLLLPQPVNPTSSYAYNKDIVDIYEFEIDVSPSATPEGLYYVELKGTAGGNLKTFLSRKFELKGSFPETVDILYYNDSDTDVYFNTGIQFNQTVMVDYRIAIPESILEVINTDDSSYLKESIGREKFEYKFEPQTLEIANKLRLGLMHDKVFINGVGYVAEEVSMEPIGNYTNDYVVKVKMYKTDEVSEVIDMLNPATNLHVAINTRTAVFNWTKSTDATGYRLYVNGSLAGSYGDVDTATLTNIPNGHYTAYVVAFNATEVSGRSNTVNYSIAIYKLSYSGLNSDGHIPTSAQILAGHSHNVPTNNIFIFNPNSTNNDYFWFAVEKAQSKTFTHWEDSGDPNNSSTIGPGQFIELKGEVTVNGDIYEVYITNWPSAFTNNINIT